MKFLMTVITVLYLSCPVMAQPIFVPQQRPLTNNYFSYRPYPYNHYFLPPIVNPYNNWYGRYPAIVPPTYYYRFYYGFNYRYGYLPFIR